MGRKTPDIFLTRGKRAICSDCHIELIPQVKSFNLKSNKSSDLKEVTDTLFMCPDCERFYVTQEICYQIVKKHPGYHVDVATYTIKTKKPKTSTTSILLTGRKEEEHHDSTERNNQSEPIDSTTSTVPLYLSNAKGLNYSICPKCKNTIGERLVNVPVIDSNDNFYRYYAANIPYCRGCNKGYITEEMTKQILKKVSDGVQGRYLIKTKNIKMGYAPVSRDFLFAPTLNNDDSIFILPSKQIASNDEQMNNLNDESFLAKMGYSTSVNEKQRREILVNAVNHYGKRRVADHLSFLILTRKKQNNGVVKYQNAIRIWQDDLNYVTSISRY